jgi:transcriptional regulator with XRE-family HTH domain
VSLGKFINEERRKRGWSLKELGEKLKSTRGTGGVSPQFLNDVEKDRRVPSDELLAQLAKILDVDEAFLRSKAEKSLPDVQAYLSGRPDASQDVGRVFRRAKETGFTDWDRIRKLIEQESDKKGDDD